MEVKTGQLVRSRAGRDKGRYFLVMKAIDDQFVLICDGELRRLEKPKKKKIKHLDILPVCVEGFDNGVENNRQMSNSTIKRLIDDCLRKQNIQVGEEV
ncbi:MAG: hypothetical protein ACOYEJ_00570 [Mahellales bacterium]|jgi:ribosomal protein L14E/L6E/L27E